MERSPTRDLIVGLFVIAGLTAVAYLSISIGGYSWRTRGGLRVFAIFSEIGDLTDRAPVRISGVRVGEVKSISLEKDFRARVELDLDPSLQLSSDTSASIFTTGLVGDRYIQLQPGGEEKLLKSGDQIPFTESAVILERLLGQVVYGLTKGDDKSNSASQPASQPATTTGKRNFP